MSPDGRQRQDPALIWKRPGADAAGTHVLIIGLGCYPHLTDRDAALTSPPKSARVLTDWFLGHFCNPDKPLASVALILSEPAPAMYAHEAIEEPKAVPAGDTSDVMKAIVAWNRRAATLEANLSVLYFCGHGIGGAEQLLMCRDYGDPDIGNAFDHTIAFDGICKAMSSSGPRHQLFLVDACREPDEARDTSILTGMSQGRHPLQPSSPPKFGRLALQSAHHAVSDLGTAGGMPNGISFFADALIQALNGGGAQPDLGYAVGTRGLDGALSAYVTRLAADEGACQIPDRSRAGPFKVHEPTTITVPIYITFSPAEQSDDRGALYASVPGHRCSSMAWELACDPEWKFMAEHVQHEVVAVFEQPARYRDGQWILKVAPPLTTLHLNFEEVS